MLGYMTQREALSYGFTHHGSYYGIPCWLAPDDDFMVATKWAPLEYLLPVIHRIEEFMQQVVLDCDEYGFRFVIGPKITTDISV